MCEIGARTASYDVADLVRRIYGHLLCLRAIGIAVLLESVAIFASDILHEGLVLMVSSSALPASSPTRLIFFYEISQSS
jgi:hypothetical protein